MIELTKFTKKDILRLLSWVTDSRFTLQWAGPKYSYDKLEENLNEAILEASNPNPNIYIFNCLNLNDNKIIGHIQLLRIDREKKEGRIGRVLICNEYRGSGYGEKMVEAVCKFGFEKVMLRKLTLAVYDFNLSAIKTYERAGFIKTEYQISSTDFREEKWSSYEMALVKI
ncbi:MAG: GNAT family N-acetyltransferase [Spirochaetes bacterium]|nr:GNAT family N-acetyltransferase [Spirochaetota bacterium]